MDIDSLPDEELTAMANDYAKKLEDLATKVGPLLAQYGQLRQEAHHMLQLLKKRGIVKVD